MVKRTVTTVTDDIDGTPGAEPVTFSLNENSYSIDLSDANRAKLEAALAPFVQHAVREGSRPARSVTWKRDELQAWARENGHRVRDRGRVPQEIIDEYLASR